MMRKMEEQDIKRFEGYLTQEEKSAATIEKYWRDIEAFYQWIKEQPIDKALVLAYKTFLTERYAVASVNSILSSLNSFFDYMVC